MQFRIVHVLAAAALTLVATIAAVVPASAQTVREIEGRVTAVDRSERSFRLTGQRGTFKIYVTSRTRYERVTFAALRAGGSAKIEATVRRSKGRWVATKVERSGGDRSRSRDDSGGDDRGRGRGSDDTHADDSR